MFQTDSWANVAYALYVGMVAAYHNYRFFGMPQNISLVLSLVVIIVIIFSTTNLTTPK
jgi:preprotein translocase subunit SecD